ncbi:SMI1/KNR4 family protein [Streptomyces cocklensis]|uniref:SMI1_KNR4 domain-containing protein n=1 Tax=Actinacidiphila cocklensis TaxID=887465 RepID=A0A9W4DPM2_9ACTN|nr:SMI1/KNR4 family protein [Actinacidiphila cocklensis]MDD1058318.1 SMI1/KNR4 family protein [Actinacidiphila cocklensis]CAG6393382.1 SMI1_KNR4 domain-containing protein [Actinacidiphila cocklensis]
MDDDPSRAERTIAAWMRIEEWLRVRAPRSYAMLPGPAEPSEIAAAEAALGKLPQELMALWSLRAGGSGSGPERLEILRGYDVFPPMDSVRCHFIALSPILEVEEMGPRPWVPACATATDEPALWNFIDVPTGQLGWNVHAGEFTEPEESGDTFAEWIESVADQLHGGQAWGIRLPGVANGWLSWEDIRDQNRIPSSWEPV